MEGSAQSDAHSASVDGSISVVSENCKSAILDVGSSLLFSMIRWQLSLPLMVIPPEPFFELLPTQSVEYEAVVLEANFASMQKWKERLLS